MPWRRAQAIYGDIHGSAPRGKEYKALQTVQPKTIVYKQYCIQHSTAQASKNPQSIDIKGLAAKPIQGQGGHCYTHYTIHCIQYATAPHTVQIQGIALQGHSKSNGHTQQEYREGNKQPPRVCPSIKKRAGKNILLNFSQCHLNNRVMHYPGETLCHIVQQHNMRGIFSRYQENTGLKIQQNMYFVESGREKG